MPTYDQRYSHYITQTFAAEDDALQSVANRLARRGQPTYSIEPEEGRFLQCLTAMCAAKKAVEFGTLGGYSGTWIARGLPSDGRLITIEVEPVRAEVARETFKQAGVLGQVELIEGDALTLLPDIGARGPFDFAFVDTSISTYPAIFDWALKHIRPGGIIAMHNAFNYGGLLHSGSSPMVTFNKRFASEPRLTSTIFPTGDGMLVGVVRGT